MGWPDRFTKTAKQQGFAARSVFKLEDIDKDVRLVRAGDRVLDLGCFPGSFCQYAGQKVGSSGLVIGVDMKAVHQRMPSNVRTFVVDVLSDAIFSVIDTYAPFDVVLSDMAPSTTGIRKLDQDRSALLVERAYEIAGHVGAKKLLVKYFQGVGVQTFFSQLQKEGVQFRTFKPKASRKESYEMFALIRM